MRAKWSNICDCRTPTLLALGCLYAIVWAASYGLAPEFTFGPMASCWWQTGLNYGTVYVATAPWGEHPRQTGLVVYDARNQGVSLRGWGVYASLAGTTPGGRSNVAILSLPLWPPLVIVLVVMWMRRRQKERLALT